MFIVKLLQTRRVIDQQHPYGCDCGQTGKSCPIASISRIIPKKCLGKIHRCLLLPSVFRIFEIKSCRWWKDEGSPSLPRCRRSNALRTCRFRRSYCEKWWMACLFSWDTRTLARLTDVRNRHALPCAGECLDCASSGEDQRRWSLYWCFHCAGSSVVLQCKSSRLRSSPASSCPAIFLRSSSCCSIFPTAGSRKQKR